MRPRNLPRIRFAIIVPASNYSPYQRQLEAGEGGGENVRCERLVFAAPSALIEIRRTGEFLGEPAVGGAELRELDVATAHSGLAGAKGVHHWCGMCLPTYM
jgi:hypothetical protein